FPAGLRVGRGNAGYGPGGGGVEVGGGGPLPGSGIRPAEGEPILFEYKGSIHVAEKLVKNVRPAYTWQFGGLGSQDKAREWARSIRAVLGELGLTAERLAVDRLDGFCFLPAEEQGIKIVDVGPATVDAREVKTHEEIELFKINGGIGDAMLAEFEAAIRPGIREYELLAVLSDALLRRHGEFLFTRIVASGT